MPISDSFRSHWKWLLILLVAICAGGYFLWSRQPAEAQPADKKGGRDAAARVIPVVAQPAKKMDVNVYLTGLGTVTPLRTVTVRSRVDGEVINDVPPKDRDMAMVFQNYALYPHMSVFENMSFGLRLKRFPKDEITRRTPSFAFWCLCGSLAHRPHERR